MELVDGIFPEHRAGEFGTPAYPVCVGVWFLVTYIAIIIGWFNFSFELVSSVISPVEYDPCQMTTFVFLEFIHVEDTFD